MLKAKLIATSNKDMGSKMLTSEGYLALLPDGTLEFDKENSNQVLKSSKIQKITIMTNNSLYIFEVINRKEEGEK